MLLSLFVRLLAKSLKKRKSKLSFSPQQTLILAHRGLTSTHLENTLLALNSALAEGADGVEFDVQLSKDNIPFVFHDRHLFRLTGINNYIDQLSSIEISQLYQNSQPYQASYRIASLAEVLSQMPADKLINI